MALWNLSGTTWWAGAKRNIHALAPILIINHPLSISSISCDPWHPACWIFVSNSLFTQSPSKFSLVYLSVWHPPLHTAYISSPNYCLLHLNWQSITFGSLNLLQRMQILISFVTSQGLACSARGGDGEVSYVSCVWNKLHITVLPVFCCCVCVAFCYICALIIILCALL